MEKKLRGNPFSHGHISDIRRPQSTASNGKVVSSDYFSAQSVMVLLFLAASLLILPLVLPPLPPPPLMLLVVPIGIFLVLLILACMPYDVRNITYCCKES